MELTKNEIKITKGIAILFMILLHLFCTKVYQGLYTPIMFIGKVPLIYYLALFGDCCVTIYCFCSGYGLFLSYKNNNREYFKNNLIRIFKLFINYWIVILLFVVGFGYILGQADKYPGDFKTFILTITAISPAYNGAWWFVTTYIILVLISTIINKIIIKYNSYLIVAISFIVYLFAYIQRIKGVVIVDNNILSWIVTQGSLLGTSQLPFIIGGIFAYKKLYSKLYVIVNKIKYKNILGIGIIFSMIIAHGIVQSLFVAVFTGIIFILVFNLMDKPKFINSLLNYIGDHSTNLWLTHMFFYMIYFKELVFTPKYSFLIFPWLVILSLLSSYLINFIYNPIINLLSNKLSREMVLRNYNNEQ